MMDGIEVLIVKPADLTDKTLHPGIIHFHGGGWTLFYPSKLFLHGYLNPFPHNDTF